MDRDTFIITVFSLVSDLYPQVTAQRPVRRGGFAPALSDEEVITIEICGEYFKLHKDCDLYDYFAAHYRHFFPRSTSPVSVCPPSGQSVARQRRHLALAG